MLTYVVKCDLTLFLFVRTNKILTIYSCLKTLEFYVLCFRLLLRAFLLLILTILFIKF